MPDDNILSKRLETILSLIDPTVDCLADIGTDHGLVPVYAVKRGLCRRAVASDLREGPLKRAALNISLSGLSDRISVVCAPGLSGLQEPADCVVIAGMGGMLINDILTDGLTEGKIFPGQTFILSAHTQEHKMRAFLGEKGFQTICECATSEEGHVYLTVKCIYDGISRYVSPTDSYTGFSDTLPAFYYENVLKRIRIRISGLSSASFLKEEETSELNILKETENKIVNLLPSSDI